MKRKTVENISWSISTKECCRPREIELYNFQSKQDIYGLIYLNKAFMNDIYNSLSGKIMTMMLMIWAQLFKANDVVS